MNFDEDYNGKTLLKDWWGKVKNNFSYLKQKLEQEISDRETAIETEENARDNAITAAVADEASLREAADTELAQSKVDKINGCGLVSVSGKSQGGYIGGKELPSKSWTVLNVDYEYNGEIKRSEVTIPAYVSDLADSSDYAKASALSDYLKKTEMDTTPTEDSVNPVTSGGIYDAINGLQTQINALHGFGADFWTGFFKTGRTDFSYAFINNGAQEIKPTQVINAENIRYMLMNCSELLDASPIVVNLTADKPVMIGVCMGCLKMTVPPVINFTGENAHVCRSYVSAYANCINMTQCTVWFGDGTQSASGDRTDMANTFLNCGALVDLTFSGSGSPKSLDLSACTLLSSESVQSLYNALTDVSTLTVGTYKITVNSEIQAKITALSLDFSAKGWTVEVNEEVTANA